jgi:hypothetical protein
MPPLKKQVMMLTSQKKLDKGKKAINKRKKGS